MIFKQKILFSVSCLLFVLGSMTIDAQEVIKVDFTKTCQKIDGFGASTAWHGQLTDKEADVSFGNGENQLGLSIIRLRIDPTGQGMWGDEMVNAKKAIKRGAIVMATPWTPPASLKTNGSAISGELKPSEYGNFVKYLISYVDYMAKNNTPLSAISLQNEPNIKVTYESCDWNATQMVDFCKNYAGDIKAPVMVPETFNFDQAFSDAILNDSLAASHIAIIGGHIYGSTIKTYPNAQAKGKPVWMTEHYVDGDDMPACITMAKEIADCMNCNMNAYIWWWLRQPSCNLITSGGYSILKKGYTLAHFSKFIRPGYYRTSATYNQYAGMTFCAFTGDKKVIVAINRKPTAVTVQFQLTGDSVTYFQKYVTTADKNLAKEGTVDVANHVFTVELEPKSIVTFVSTDSACEPTVLTPFLKIDSGELVQTDSISIPSTSAIQLAPQPTSGGSWSWNGCDVSGTSTVKTFTPTVSCQAMATFTNMCGAKSSLNFNISVLPVGVNTMSFNEAFHLFPNPVVKGKFTLRIDKQDDEFPIEMKIFSIEGRVVFEKKIKVNETVIEPDLKPALYLLKFQGKKVKHTQKLIVE